MPRVLLRRLCHSRRYHPTVVLLISRKRMSGAVDVLERIVPHLPESVDRVEPSKLVVWYSKPTASSGRLQGYRFPFLAVG